MIDKGKGMMQSVSVKQETKEEEKEEKVEVREEEKKPADDDIDLFEDLF